MKGALEFLAAHGQASESTALEATSRKRSIRRCINQKGSGSHPEVQASSDRHQAAMKKIGALVNVRERCEKEVRERLARAEFTPEEIDDAVATALRYSIISDERYARSFIRGKTNLGWGRLKITQQLERNGISDAIITSCQDEFSSADGEYERALHELERRPTHAKNPRSSLMHRLVNKGYSFDVANRAVSEYLQQMQQ